MQQGLDAKDPNGKIVIGTTAIVPPYTFFKNEELSGIDIELARRIAKRLNYKVEFKVYDYISIIVAAASGQIDSIFANLNWTKERAENIDYSDFYSQVKTAILVKDDNANSTINRIEDFHGKNRLCQ